MVVKTFGNEKKRHITVYYEASSKSNEWSDDRNLEVTGIPMKKLD